MLLCAAIHVRKQLHTLADIQEADALGTMEFVRADRQHVDVHLLYIQRDVTERLNRVGMEKHAVAMSDFTDCLQRLNGSNLVVRRHDGNQHSIRTNRRFNGFRRNHAVRIDRQNGHLKALAFERLGAVQDGVMLNRRDNQVTPLFLVGAHRTLERPVVALRAAAGEENLRARRADHVGDLLARLLHRRVAGVGEAVCAGRIGILLGQVWHHGLKCPAAEPRCRGVVHIDHEKFSPIYLVIHSMRRFGVTGMRPCAPPKRFRPPG